MKSFNQIILQPLFEVLTECPDRNALCIAGRYFTYRQFSERISAIRVAIRATHCEESLFALAIHDDIDTYAAIFALWMEGKAYVPLHPNQPIERNLNIVNQISCKYILDSAQESSFNVPGLPSVVLCSVMMPYKADCIQVRPEESEDLLAYILFTSGSTGIPKGVQISRSNLASFLDAFWKSGIKVTSEDRCLQAFDLTFDVSVQSFLVALTRGACVFTVPYGHVKYLSVASLIQEQQITFGAMAPSMLTYLRPYFSELNAGSLKTCILTAEACPMDLVEDWFDCASNADVYDFYGPTEATIYCTFYKLNRNGRNLSFNGSASIGKPMENVKAIIIREDGTLVSGQEKGELCIAGSQVTPGYWNNPEKNISSFIVRENDRYYCTGDLCYWDPSGNIMYSGRIDQQAKIQGFRVELGEIEHHVRLFYENEFRVVAIAFQNKQNLTEIALFIESQK